jgi:DNA-binding HxlR family transcriptional regulator
MVCRGLPSRPGKLIETKVQSYRQFCGVAKALDVLGGRWTLLIIRDLVLGPRRYVDLHKSLIGITTNLLADRLKLLQGEGLIETVSLPSAAAGHAYALTPLGHELEAVVFSLGAFGTRYMRQPERGEAVDPRWAMVSMKRRYQGSKHRGRVQLQLGDQRFATAFGGAEFDVRDGDMAAPEATLVGQMPAWFRLFTRQTTFRDTVGAGGIAVTGSRRVAGALVKALGLRA